ncbi:hypothetical protein GCM10009099_42260 [Caenispirillum bisanense]
MGAWLMRTWLMRTVLLAGAALAALAGEAGAQTLPGTVDPGRLLQQFEQQAPVPESRAGRTVLDSADQMPPNRPSASASSSPR